MIVSSPKLRCMRHCEKFTERVLFLCSTLEGALRLSTIADLCSELGIMIGSTSNGGAGGHLDAHREHFCLVSDSAADNLRGFLDKMMHTQALLASEDIIRRVAYEVVEDAHLNGVKLLELRYSPSFILQSGRRDHSHMSMESVHGAIVEGINRAKVEFDIEVGLIGILDR